MYSIWVEPIAKDAKYLLTIIRKLGKEYHAPMFCPHITVYSGVRSISDARKAIRNCDMKKFAIRTKELDFSDNLWKTVFVNVEKSQKLMHVNHIIRDSIPDSKYDFCPHISLIYKKLDDSVKQEIIGSLKIKRKFTFDKITVVASSKTVSKWKTVDRMVLK